MSVESTIFLISNHVLAQPTSYVVKGGSCFDLFTDDDGIKYYYVKRDDAEEKVLVTDEEEIELTNSQVEAVFRAKSIMVNSDVLSSLDAVSCTHQFYYNGDSPYSDKYGKRLEEYNILDFITGLKRALVTDMKGSRVIPPLMKFLTAKVKDIVLDDGPGGEDILTVVVYNY